MRYDPDRAPAPGVWLALSRTDRIHLVEEAHRGLADGLHGGPPRHAPMHHRLHQLVEEQIATREPAVTAETVARLERAGLRRHVALHMVIGVLLRHLGAGGWDDAAWTADLRTLDAAAWLGDQMRRAFAEE